MGLQREARTGGRRMRDLKYEREKLFHQKNTNARIGILARESRVIAPQNDPCIYIYMCVCVCVCV